MPLPPPCAQNKNTLPENTRDSVAPGQPFEEDATQENISFVQGKTVTFDYDAYTSDRFGRVLAYVIVGGKNVSVELARQGLAKVTIYADRRKLKYQDELLKAQDEAKQKMRGIWLK